MVKPTDTVLDLGCGYGNFINNIECAVKIAIDSWPDAAKYLKPDVKLQIGSITDLSGVGERSIDFVLASNVFEHLGREEFYLCLKEVRRILRTTGTINILQPNYRFCYDEYFDDYTHLSIYSDRSLCDLLRTNGMRIIECKPRFLPLTVKSRLPVWPAMVRAYLKSPVKPLAKQMFIRAALDDPQPAGGDSLP
ncbi:MAG: class I SAM-dependent methyltransferase [Candidatus Eremiobacteraeota bacterium]|nr:class I SAM-dependent methyltransferase [Candidatus Eremiobacteraeota bacterium]